MTNSSIEDASHYCTSVLYGTDELAPSVKSQLTVHAVHVRVVYNESINTRSTSSTYYHVRTQKTARQTAYAHIENGCIGHRISLKETLGDEEVTLLRIAQ